MIKKLSAFIDWVSTAVSPFMAKVVPFYKKNILPRQKRFSSAFMLKIAPFLKLAPSDKKKILEQNLVGKLRAASIAFCLILALYSVGISFSAGAVFISVFVSYLMFRGYRAAYVMGAVFVMLDVFCLLGYAESNGLLLFLWLVLALVAFAFAFKYENARISLENGFELKRSQYSLQRDVIAAFIYSAILWIVAFILLVITSLGMNAPQSSAEDREALNAAAGIAARHIYGYTDYCKSQGYELKRYPEVFAKKFEPSIIKIQAQLAEQDSTLAIFYENAKLAFGKRLFDSLAADIDEVRKQAIIEAVALKNNVSASQVVWSDDYNKEISPEEGCVIFDEMASSIVSSSSADLQKLKNY